MRLIRKDDVCVHQVEDLARDEFGWLRFPREDEFSGQQGKVLEGQIRDGPSRHVCNQTEDRAADYEAENKTVNLTSSRSTSLKDVDQESDELILMHRKRGRSPSPRRRRRARAEREAERQRQERRYSWSIGAGKTRASTETCSRRPLTAPWQRGKS